MKTTKNMANCIQLIVLIVLLLFQYKTSFAQTCPPCLLEKDAKDEAHSDLNLKISLQSAADGNVQTWQNNDAVATGAMVTAAAAAGAACLGLQAVTPACWAALAALASTEAYCAYCLYNWNKAIDDLNKAIDDRNAAQNAFNAAKNAYLACMARVAGQCKKCENGNIVPDNSQDPGMCKKCENGAVVNDDSKIPPDPCKKCENGAVVDKCSANQNCCNGTCVDKQYEWTVTTVVTTCDGPSSPVVTTTNTQPNCGSTGQLEYSFGVCVGGSVVTVTCSGPNPVPCR